MASQQPPSWQNRSQQIASNAMAFTNNSQKNLSSVPRSMGSANTVQTLGMQQQASIRSPMGIQNQHFQQLQNNASSPINDAQHMQVNQQSPARRQVGGVPPAFIKPQIQYNSVQNSTINSKPSNNTAALSQLPVAHAGGHIVVTSDSSSTNVAGQVIPNYFDPHTGFSKQVASPPNKTVNQVSWYISNLFLSTKLDQSTTYNHVRVLKTPG